jgi:hypothetical protein
MKQKICSGLVGKGTRFTISIGIAFICLKTMADLDGELKNKTSITNQIAPEEKRLERPSDQNITKSNPNIEIPLLRIKFIKKDQLFGSASSWSVQCNVTNLQLVSWVEDVSDPKKPRRLKLDLKRSVRDEGLIQFGFMDENLEGKSGYIIATRAYDQAVSRFVEVVFSNQVVRQERLIDDGDLSVTIPVNKPFKLATIEFPTSQNHESFAFYVELHQDTGGEAR